MPSRSGILGSSALRDPRRVARDGQLSGRGSPKLCPPSLVAPRSHTPADRSESRRPFVGAVSCAPPLDSVTRFTGDSDDYVLAATANHSAAASGDRDARGLRRRQEATWIEQDVVRIEAEHVAPLAGDKVSSINEEPHLMIIAVGRRNDLDCKPTRWNAHHRSGIVAP
jgi:hypothetical protein